DNPGGSADWCKPDHTDDDMHPSQCSGNSKVSAWRSAPNSDRAHSRTAGTPAFLAVTKAPPCAGANGAYSSPTAPAPERMSHHSPTRERQSRSILGAGALDARHNGCCVHLAAAMVA